MVDSFCVHDYVPCLTPFATCWLLASHCPDNTPPLMGWVKDALPSNPAFAVENALHPYTNGTIDDVQFQVHARYNRSTADLTSDPPLASLPGCWARVSCSIAFVPTPP